MTEPDKLVEVKYANDDTTHWQFRFVKNGNKSIKSEEKGKRRQHYKCSVGSCQARYYEDYLEDSKDKTEPRKFNGIAHNHLPPSNPKVRKEVKDKCLDYFRVGVTPTVAHKRCVNDADESMSPADVPSIAQLKSWKHRLVMKDMPSGMNLHCQPSIANLKFYRRCLL